MDRKDINKVKTLQLLSYDIYLNTISRLKSGMSENDIAEIILKQYKRAGIENFWYDIPIMVLIGEKRFLDMNGDYEKKTPSDKYLLNTGDTINFDFTPIEKDGLRGTFSATYIFRPKTDYDFEKIEFLKLMRKIQRDGIKQITSLSRVDDIANWYLDKFRGNGITLVDVRNNLGHSMHKGAKKNSDESEKRIFIDTKNNNPIGEGIFAIEPAGFKRSKNEKDKILVGKFEDCLYVPVNSGIPLLLVPDNFTDPGSI